MKPYAMAGVRIYQVAEARATVLRRVRWEDQEMPQRVLDEIEHIFGEPLAPAEATARILRDVRNRGDEAVHEWSERIDGIGGVTLPGSPAGRSLEIPRNAWEASYERLPGEQRDALRVAAERIADFHRKQPVDSWLISGPGGVLGQLIRPIQQVGVYVPGETAPLPSSLLMAAIPAREAGVETVIACTPPSRRGISDLILAAAHLSRIDRLFAVGGAQAIACMAYGTQTIPTVDKIVGAGGLFVTLAKRQVVGSVGIDGFYGPTETLLIADETANPAWVAADLLAQAEHDVLASPLLFTPEPAVAEAVAEQLTLQLQQLSRAEIASAALAARGGIVVTADLKEAVELANAYAPEHLCLLVQDPWDLVGKVNNAGGVFVGEHSFEALGDYVAGPSHVMPTEGSARYASPLNVADFVKRINLVALSAAEGARLSTAAAVLAQAEGLTAHAAAAEMRCSSDPATEASGDGAVPSEGR